MKSTVAVTEPIQNINIIRHILPDDGRFPNNNLLPLLVYSKVLHLPEDEDLRIIIDIFESNNWSNAWTNGIYDFHHYHSTTHEVLGIARGSARVLFGGDQGVSLVLERGDVVIIPAGVAHKNLGNDPDFVCVGAYPDGLQYDMYYGREGERPRTDETIRKLRLPRYDPVYGIDGPLIKNWAGEKTV